MPSPIAAVVIAIAVAGGAVAALAFVARLAVFYRPLRGTPVLGPASHAGGPVDAPPVTVIVAAKDEEANIEPCVRSILAQDYPALQVIAVDDRSTDGTLPALQRLARDDARLRVLQVTELPGGWGGQNHALWRGVQESTGEWLCFTDADCRWDARRLLAVAWAEARERGADLLSIIPRMETPTLWERIYLPVCGLVFMMRLRIGEVNDPARPAAYANGAFMLARRQAYLTLGGHERVKDQLNDDLALAALAKREGVRVRIAGNGGLYRTRMYRSVGQAFTGWTRNFSGAQRTSRRLLATLALALGMFVLPWAGLLATAAAALFIDPRFGAAAAAWGAAVAVSHAAMWLLYPAFDRPAWESLLFFPGAVFVSAIVARALGRSLRGTGTRWQGAHYGGDQKQATGDRQPATGNRQ